jgi:hypothetical protein
MEHLNYSYLYEAPNLSVLEVSIERGFSVSVGDAAPTFTDDPNEY